MPDHKIASIQVTQHRLELNPAFNASWDTKPRVHFDATLVRVTTDTGLTGYGSGDLMVDGVPGVTQLLRQLLDLCANG